MTQNAPRHLPAARGALPAATAKQPAAKTQAAKPEQPKSAKAEPAYLSSAAPTPPPVTTPVPERATVRDPVFMHHATALLASALLMPLVVSDETDEKHALNTAESIARLLDTGEVPEGYVTPENAAAIAQTLYYTHSTPNGPIASNEGEKNVRNAQLVEHEKKLGRVKTVGQIKKENDELLATLVDISEPVRSTALTTTAFLLAALGKAITGAHPNEAVGIAVNEILRAIRLAEKFGVPTRGIETVAAQIDAGEIDQETAERALPYPASVAMDMTKGLLQALRDQAEGQMDDPSAQPTDDASTQGDE